MNNQTNSLIQIGWNQPHQPTEVPEIWSLSILDPYMGFQQPLPLPRTCTLLEPNKSWLETRTMVPRAKNHRLRATINQLRLHCPLSTHRRWCIPLKTTYTSVLISTHICCWIMGHQPPSDPSLGILWQAACQYHGFMRCHASHVSNGNPQCECKPTQNEKGA